MHACLGALNAMVTAEAAWADIPSSVQSYRLRCMHLLDLRQSHQRVPSLPISSSADAAYNARMKFPTSLLLQIIPT